MIRRYRRDAGATKAKTYLTMERVQSARMSLMAYLWRQGKTSKAGADMVENFF